MSEEILHRLMLAVAIILCIFTIIKLSIKMRKRFGIWLIFVIGIAMFLGVALIEFGSSLLCVDSFLIKVRNCLLYMAIILINVGVVKGIDNILSLRESASRDALTGLYNRRAFYEQLDLEIRRADKEGHIFDVIIMDIDDFKSINDKYGHLVGDLALKEIAGILIDEIKESDLIVRYGGDEFVILIVAPDSSPYAIKERVMGRILESNFLSDKVKGISVGWATYPIDGTDGDLLLEAADKVMYIQKYNHKP